MTYATAALTPPARVDDSTATLIEVVDSLAVLSPTGVLLEFLEWAFGENPVQAVANRIVGDWTSVDTAAQALRNLAEFSRRFSTSVESSLDVVLQDGRDFPNANAPVHVGWTGFAASQAAATHRKLAATSDEFAAEVDEAAEAVDAMTDAIRAHAAAITTAIESLLDAAVIAAACWASSWVTSVFGAACGAVATGVVYTKWAEIVSQIDTARDVLSALWEGATGRAAAAEQITDVMLPRVYDHPAVAPPPRPVHPGLQD